MVGGVTPPPLSGPTTKKNTFFYACLPLVVRPRLLFVCLPLSIKFIFMLTTQIKLKCKVIKFTTKFSNSTAGPAYYVLHPQKGITICVFLTYQAFKNREGIVSRKNLAEGLQIYVFLFHKIIYGQIHCLGYKAIVHTFCFLLLVSYFNEMVICFNIW